MNQKGQKEQDLILWKKVQNEDRLAFDELYHSYVRLLYNYGLKITANRPLIEDSIQEIFITIWSSKGRLKLNRSIKYYLLQSFRRHIFKKLQKSEIVSLDISEIDQIQKLDSPPLAPPLLLQQKKQVKKALELLPKRQKEAIYLKYYEQMDYEEIAEIMSLQIHGVYKLVSQGIKKLRVHLKK